VLVDLFPLIEGYNDFRLSSTPVGPIQVDVNGVPTTGWSFDTILNDIEFSVLPKPGSTITVNYAVGCQ
jgi:hypothetical protein